ncbi:hypothetical protein [Ammonifex thiophilus]|uniref:ABC transporter permease n=1 Tax=Ammonifex thiophilus TaxID=444093 RepID=A0A3D8P1V0_9THEO|nr:hypothetical protein [Ammonifex thiophilus]RDV82044.1 hypothetical protein DXX99_08300 [Ammonifex thiophilus]
MPDVLRIIKAELMRVSRQPFFYVIPLLALLLVIPGMIGEYKYALALHYKTLPLPPGASPPPSWGAELDVLLHWFRWKNLPGIVGPDLLGGWGIALFIYTGAVWFGNDLRTGVIRQLAVLRECLATVIAGKALALILYIVAVLGLTVFGAVITTLFLPEVPGREVGALLSVTFVRNIAIYISIALLWALLAAAVTIFAASELLGGIGAFVWTAAEKIAFLGNCNPTAQFFARVAPWSTCQSLLASSLCDNLSWLGNTQYSPEMLTLRILPLTFTTGAFGPKPYLLPFLFLLAMLGIYLLVGTVAVFIGYRWRVSK